MPYTLNSKQSKLTPREAEVLLHIARGRTHKQVAALLFRAESTIKSHMENIALKLGSMNVANMVAVAFDKGILKLLPCVLVAVLGSNGLASDFSLRRPPRPVGVSRTVARVRMERLGGAAA